MLLLSKRLDPIATRLSAVSLLGLLRFGYILCHHNQGIEIVSQSVSMLVLIIIQTAVVLTRAVSYLIFYCLMPRIVQGLIVDQTIEKVSFCAPDREHAKGFSYICRDGTTRRWMCHGFLALKESVSVYSLSTHVYK